MSHTFHTSMRASFGSVRLGQTFDSLTAKAKVLTTDTQASYRTTSYDVNGDGTADMFLTESLDAQGAVSSRSLTASQTDAQGKVKSFSVMDMDNDGKVDFFSHQSGNVYVSTQDNNHDGKADSQFTERFGKTGQMTSSDSFSDSDYDGKADYDYKTRAGRKSDAMPSAPTLPQNGAGSLGAPIEHVVPVGGTKVYETDTATGRSIGFDTNADGAADIWESDALDASGKTTSRWYSISDPAQQNKYVGGVGDTNADGIIDYVSSTGADGSTVAAQDWNQDGKVDNVTVSNTDGGYTNYQDSNADGVADFITTGGKIA